MTYTDVLDHDLIAIDGSGSHCSCGEVTDDWLEHLGTTALTAVGVSAPSRTRTRGDEGCTRADMLRTQRVLRERADEQERLAARADELGLAGIPRIDWLIAQRSADDALAWDLKWARLGLPGPYLPGPYLPGPYLPAVRHLHVVPQHDEIAIQRKATA